MSHVTDIEFECNDLDSLKKAAQILGLEFKENQNKFKWFGRHVGDYPLPKGFTKEDMGKCDHALSVKDNNAAYEVGVIKRRDGKPGFQLLWDFWAGGHGLQEKVGVDGNKLKQEYQVQLAIKHQTRRGLRVSRYEDEEGNVFVKAIGRGAF